mmetsp:Transcript_14051/g.29578  ORF Transcript_14051/g.29578 Transcript_14051/m.29578 type:complete len:104 (+) Transcript_14051:46-357(+)
MDQHTDFDAFALRASGLHYADSGTDTDTDNDSDTDNSKQDHHHNDNDDYAVGITRDDDGSRKLMDEDDEFFGLAAKGVLAPFQAPGDSSGDNSEWVDATLIQV